ncbi:MAG: penicillin acylase family protein [Chitinophagia bacterium]|jgi:penicillin amidase
MFKKIFFLVSKCLLLIIIVPDFLLAQKRQSDFPSEQKLSIRGLQSQVNVIRDKWGINHIYAQNEHDLFFAQGYCAARDRLFQFEIWRRQATGTTAEIFGSRELQRDIGTRLFQYRGDLHNELQHYHSRGEKIINAYVEGVNAYIREAKKHPSSLPIEFSLLKILPEEWTPAVVISRHQGLLGNITQELNIARAVAKVGAEKVKEIVWFHPKQPDLSIDSTIPINLLSKDILSLYNAYRKDLVFQKSDITEVDEDAVQNILPQTEKDLFLLSQEKEGSNNWIVSGRKSASGYPLLANDPHRKIAVPSLRYMVHLIAPGWNVIGAGEPEIPGVSIGHNEYGAWGLTIFETDGEDLYVYNLNKNNLRQYWHKGKWLDMKIIKDTIRVKDSKSVIVEHAYTIHGPVCFIDSASGKAFAVRAAWLEPGGAPYLASLRINQAANWEQFRDACSFSNIPGENMIWADKKGNIGWQAVGIIPVRKNFSGYVPVPGDGRFEWDGFLPIKERPSLLNPSSGFFATANQNVTPDQYNRWDAIGYTWADSFRGNRINQVLSKKNSIDLPTMGALQTDYFSIPASKLVPFLQALTITDTSLLQAVTYLNKWDFILDKNSIAAGIYVAWEKEIAAACTQRFIPESIRSYVNFQLTSLIERLENPALYFGNNFLEQRNDLLVTSFLKAIQSLQKKLGPNMKDWMYGQPKYKHITLEHPLAASVNTKLQQQLNLGPLPRGGNGQTPGSTGGTDNQMSGASFRILVDTKDWDKTLFINTPGQSGDPKSPFYKNLFELWANDQYFPAYYSKQQIKKVEVEQMKLLPIK